MPTIPSSRRAVRQSLFHSGLGPRLALAGALSAGVWLTIAWALAT